MSETETPQPKHSKPSNIFQRIGQNLMQNQRGEWVPAIPEPLFLAFGRVRCDCGAKYRNRNRYREHYALTHILEGKETADA